MNSFMFSFEDGLSIQMLHIGSYGGEADSFAQMKEFICDNSLNIITLQHREIYITDARKTHKEKLKIVLLYRVK